MPAKYITPQTQALPWLTIVYKKDGVWLKYGTTYRPDLAQSWYGSLTNDASFTNEGIKVIETEDQESYLTEALSVLNEV